MRGRGKEGKSFTLDAIFLEEELPRVDRLDAQQRVAALSHIAHARHAYDEADALLGVVHAEADLGRVDIEPIDLGALRVQHAPLALVALELTAIVIHSAI